MSQRISMIALLGAVSLTAACGSNHAAAGTGGASGMGGTTGTGGAASTSGGSDAGGDSDASTNCVSRDGLIIRADELGEFPFVTVAFSGIDYCNPFPDLTNECPPSGTTTPGKTTGVLSQPEAGTLCLAGTVSPGGFDGIIMEFSTKTCNLREVLKTFDANRLGITQVAFTIDSPPSGGVTVQAHVTTNLSCPNSILDCFRFGFGLMTAPGSSTPLAITQPGRINAPFANFQQTVDNPTQNLDTRSLDGISFDVLNFDLQNQGPYNFCVHDFQFLNAQGIEVKP